MIYDYIIVGAGISGLNTGIEILKRNPKDRVVILEKNSSRTGGRVFTDKFKIGSKQYAFDAGAGRFSDTHKRLLGLIHRYKLTDKMYKLSKSSKFIKKGEYSNSVKFPDSDTIIREMIKIVEKMTSKQKENLKNMTFKELAAKLFNRETAEFLEKGYPYYSEISIINAESAIKSFKGDLNSRKNFYVLIGGLSQIIDNMTNEFISLGGRLVKSFEVSTVIRADNGIFSVESNSQELKRAHNLVFSVPKNVLEKIDYLNPLKQNFKALKCKPLYRIYTVYPKNKITGKVWFHDIPRTITDSRIKYIIPINPDEGSIMISYTDAYNAKYWHNISDKTLISRLHREVQRLYPEITEIPEPLVTKKYFWDTGACYYRKGTNPNELQKSMINPLSNVYICGDSFSSHQAWMEGALETSEKVIKSIFN